jgi:hypothetical protein
MSGNRQRREPGSGCFSWRPRGPHRSLTRLPWQRCLDHIAGPGHAAAKLNRDALEASRYQSAFNYSLAADRRLGEGKARRADLSSSAIPGTESEPIQWPESESGGSARDPAWVNH